MTDFVLLWHHLIIGNRIGISSSPPPVAMEPGTEDPLASTALPSLLTSACIIAVLYKTGDVSLLRLVFYTLLPVLSSLACLQDKRFLATFKRLFLWYVLRVDANDDKESSAHDALAAARQELLKAIGDRWPTARGRRTSPFTVSRFTPGTISETSTSGVGNGGSNTGKSLYDQVRSHLTDHTFPKNHDAPIYFMDPATGLFLRVNETHKLVFTETPDASCLFHVVKGKTHHWGFHSTIHQRYIGQNVIGKVVVNSKKMQGWESFRVLERPNQDTKSKPHHRSEAGRTVYFVLCSARFGKGMWLGKRKRTSADPTDTYLTKDFAHALALVYASDLSAFEYLSHPRASLGERQSLTESSSELQATSSASSLSLPDSETEPFGTDYQVPVLTTAERAKVVLPWIDDASNRRFHELSERQMVDVVSTTISRTTVRDLLEFFLDQDGRRMAHQNTSQAPSRPTRSTSGSSTSTAADKSSSSPTVQRSSEWHLHPVFGFVRKHAYRPPPPSSPSPEGTKTDTSEAPLSPSLAASIAIEEFDSCVVDEKTMQKAVYRSKVFTLSIPKSNGFSVETVFEFQDSLEREGMYTPMNNAVIFKCRTGLHFTRKTVFSAQIQKGVLEGVKNACTLLLKRVDEFRLARPSSSSSLQQQAETGRSSFVGDSSPQVRSPKDAFPRHTLAIEIIKGMVSTMRGSDRVGSNIPRRVRSSLNIQMPWTPASVQSRTQSASAIDRPLVRGFFECPPSKFEDVLEESLQGESISPSLVFDVLLSDECSFIVGRNHLSGNLEVDIGAWRLARFSTSSGTQAQPFMRKQLYRMPVKGVTGLDVVHVEDYHYYAMKQGSSSDSQGEQLEFGMKIFARDLPDGERFTIEVIVKVTQASSASTSENGASPSCSLQVLYAIAARGESQDKDDDPLVAALVQGTVRGLKSVWKRVAQVIQDAANRSARNGAGPASADDVRYCIQLEGQLPSHDELSSKIIGAITALY